jgi:CBS-domain-containing membrane protein
MASGLLLINSNASAFPTQCTLPAELRAVSEEDARYLLVGQVAQAIRDISSIREDDSLLVAFEEMEGQRLPYVTVLSLSERLVGVVTSKDIASFSRVRKPVSDGRCSDPDGSSLERVA